MINNPVSGDLFFGRESYLSLLRKRVQAHEGGYRQNIAVFGPPLVGKTSLLYNFLRTWNNQSIIPAYICLKEVCCAEFIDKFGSAILYNYLNADGKEVKEDKK